MRMIKRFSLALAILLVLITARLAMATGPLEMVFFYSPTCESCHMVREQMMPPLVERYGAQLAVTYVDLSQAAGLEQLEAIESRLGQPNSPLPVIVLSPGSGSEEIVASDDFFELEDALNSALSRRIEKEPTEAESQAVVQATVAPTVPVQVTRSAAIIHIAYIEKEGCQNCARALVALDTLDAEYPGLAIERFSNMQQAAVVEAMGEHLGLSQDRRLVAPSVYVGGDALVGDEITSGNLRNVLASYADSGAPAFWEGMDAGSGASSIVSRFQRMGPLAVVIAALIDGINPCAFATIVFFVSYLAISRRKRSALLAVGLAFAAGVFVTYLLIGLGAMSLLKLASAFRIVGMVLYGLMALSCFVLSVLSFRDYMLARQGRLSDMALNLPEPLRKRIHGRIRSNSGAFMGAAFVSGLVVSILELACTGQVYLPTISFVVAVPEMRASAVAYLVLYNVVFIIPLLVVLILAAFGVSAQRFQDWFVKNAARSKLVVAILFVLLGALLVSQFLSL